jgi:hypothetical protein
MHAVRAKVNQQLAWCRTLLAAFGASGQPWQQQALAQGLGWHLQAAYVAFLQELASELRFPADRPASVQDLLNVVPAGRAGPQELLELQRLERDHTWLSALRAQPQPSQSVASPASVVAGASLIAVAGAPDFGLEQAQVALNALTELIERNRNLAAES